MFLSSGHMSPLVQVGPDEGGGKSVHRCICPESEAVVADTPCEGAGSDGGGPRFQERLQVRCHISHRWLSEMFTCVCIKLSYIWVC